MKIKLFLAIIILLFSNALFAQRPPNGPPPNGQPPRDGRGRPVDRDDDREDRFPPMRGGDGDDHHDWQKAVDSNKNGKIETDEFRAAADTFFKRQDKNNNGVLEENEFPMPRGEGRPPKD
jgi:hypothetical protein